LSKPFQDLVGNNMPSSTRAIADISPDLMKCARPHSVAILLLINRDCSIIADVMLVSTHSTPILPVCQLSFGFNQIHRCYILWGSNKFVLYALGGAAFILNGAVPLRSC